MLKFEGYKRAKVHPFPSAAAEEVRRKTLDASLPFAFRPVQLTPPDNNRYHRETLRGKTAPHLFSAPPWNPLHMHQAAKSLLYMV